MYRLVPCIPILRVFFLIKNAKRMYYVNILLLVLILFKICVFICKKGISNIFGLDRCKTYCSPSLPSLFVQLLLGYQLPLNILFSNTEHLRISSNTSSLLADILDCIASIIAVKSFLSSLPKFSSVYDDIV